MKQRKRDSPSSSSENSESELRTKKQKRSRRHKHVSDDDNAARSKTKEERYGKNRRHNSDLHNKSYDREKVIKSEPLDLQGYDYTAKETREPIRTDLQERSRQTEPSQSRKNDRDRSRSTDRRFERRHQERRRQYSSDIPRNSRISNDEQFRGVKEEQFSAEETQRKERRMNEQKRIDRRKEENVKHPLLESGESKFNWGKAEANTDAPLTGANAAEEKEKPNFATSGKLAADTNTFNGVVVKYNEPQESRKPKLRWRLYPFKGDETLPVLYIHRQSAYMIGRDRRVCDIPVDHPSCSKQHAVLQYRVVKHEREDGSLGRKIKPYIIDLGSANGTFLNNKKVEPQRYVEIREKDVLKFGFSTREYVVLNESSQDSEDEADKDN